MRKQKVKRDVLAAHYTIAPLADGRTLLRLTSEYRLQTRFNGYGRWWVDGILRDFQAMVLHVVQARAEQGGVPPNG